MADHSVGTTEGAEEEEEGIVRTVTFRCPKDNHKDRGRCTLSQKSFCSAHLQYWTSFTDILKLILMRTSSLILLSNLLQGGALGCRIYVGNLSWDVKWQDLKDFFKPCGTVVRADVMEEPGGRSKGCGTLRTYSTHSDTYAHKRTQLPFFRPFFLILYLQMIMIIIIFCNVFFMRNLSLVQQSHSDMIFILQKLKLKSNNAIRIYQLTLKIYRLSYNFSSFYINLFKLFFLTHFFLLFFFRVFIRSC